MRRCREERGSVTLWVLGLTLMMLFIGGIGIDLWRAFSERRALATAVDAAAIAGASGIDVDYYRETSQVRLDPRLAEQLAAENLAAQTDARRLLTSDIEATETEVSVMVTRRVEFTLLRIFLRGEPFTITVRGAANPRRSE